MWQSIIKLRDILGARERRRALILLAMILVMGIVESTRVASILPFVAVLADPTVIQKNTYLLAIYNWFGFTSTDQFLLFLGVALFVVLIGTLSLSALLQYATLRFSSMRNYALSQKLFEGYLGQPYGWFLRRNSADLGKGVLSEVSQVITNGLMPAIQLTTQGVIAAAMIITLLVVDPLLAVIVTVTIGGGYWAVFRATRLYLGRIGAGRFAANTERFRVSNEAFGGIKDVKVLGLEKSFGRRFGNASYRQFNLEVISNLIGTLPQYALQAFAFGLVLGIVLYQILTQRSLTETLPIIAVYALAGQRLMPALQGIYGAASRLRYARPSLDALHHDLAEIVRLAAVNQEPQSDERIGLNERIELTDVSYRYPVGNSPAVDQVSLTIPCRTAVGFVGQTGAGKTTIVDIILGLLAPSSGTLSIDGQAISAGNRRAWLTCVGYVPQHIFLADDTVAANIAFGMTPSEIDMAAVERAASIANLDGFVREGLENGYDTVIGERGVRLSGGQRQRVGIARALYRDPDLLIMDEGTSALDGITERAVMDAIHNLARRKTIILVAHRLSTVRICDQIFLLDHGRVVASGSYDELARTDDRFKAMVSAGHG